MFINMYHVLPSLNILLTSLLFYFMDPHWLMPRQLRVFIKIAEPSHNLTNVSNC